MKKAIITSIIITFAVCMPLLAQTVYLKTSLIDADLQYVIGDTPFGSYSRTEINFLSYAVGWKFLMFGMSLRQILLSSTEKYFEFPLVLEVIIPIITWPTWPGNQLFGFVFNAHWAGLITGQEFREFREGSHLEARLEFLLPFVAAYMGTLYFYEVATYRPNLTLGLRLGLMTSLIDLKKGAGDSDSVKDGPRRE